MTAEARTLTRIGLAAALALAVALAARLGLVENQGLLAGCAADPATGCGPALLAREAVVRSFVDGYLGWLAATAAALGLFSRWRAAAWSGWILGIAGMVLYNVEPASAGALLALLLLARRPPGERQHGA